MSKIFFKYGTMNSSKSAQLLMTAHNYRMQNKSYLVFKSKTDTRDSGKVKSRALGEELDAIMIDKDELWKMYEITRQSNPHCILVDEVNFMTKEQVDELSLIADELGVIVICYGLLVDFQSNLFEGSKRLIEIGAKLEEIKNECVNPSCKRKATQNLRLNNGVPIFYGEQIQMGKEESYQAICYSCYLKHKKGIGGDESI